MVQAAQQNGCPWGAAVNIDKKLSMLSPLAPIPYQLEIEDESLTVRFDRNFFDNNDVQEMLEFLRLKIVRKRAQLRDEDVAALADEV